MLTRLTKAMRLRAAVIIAVLYALCIVTPGLALAFADSASAAHCLTADHRGNAKASKNLHDHGGGVVHSHVGEDESSADADGKSSSPGKCCGLFCTTALPAAYHVALGGLIHGSSVLPSVQEDPIGRNPDRTIRPPISSLSL